MSRFWQVVYALAPYFYKCRDFVVRWATVIGVKTLCLLAFAVLVLIFLIRGASASDGAVWIAVQSDGSGIAHISAEQMQQCENEGGCDFITRERLVGEMQRAAKAVKGKYCI